MNLRAVDLIRQKRDGGALDRAAIEFFVAGATDGTLPDYQVSALLMAILLRGMTAEETAVLTDAMVRSGSRVTYEGIRGVPVDKHSTGGVGDKTSLILAPLAAAAGAPVPMMSGRGLGHTGGTLDKLESIPGFRTGLTLDELRAAVSSIGCALIGQTSEIAPADRKLYALRDVTGTVESIPLICASIMSKKIAEGIGGLVLDVKTGAGAFMKSLDDSRNLARSLVAIGIASGVRTEALITRMDAPLGRAVGNANEVIESIETLKGKGPADLEDLSCAAGCTDARALGCVCRSPVGGTSHQRCIALGRRGREVPGGHCEPGWGPAGRRRLCPHAVSHRVTDSDRGSGWLCQPSAGREHRPRRRRAWCRPGEARRPRRPCGGHRRREARWFARSQG